jgi:hypothetical protein
MRKKPEAFKSNIHGNARGNKGNEVYNPGGVEDAIVTDC